MGCTIGPLNPLILNPNCALLLESLNSNSLHSLQTSMPNYGGNVSCDSGNFPVSYLELSKPTGKYVYRWVLKLVSKISAKGFIQYSGNACTPGLNFPNIDPQKGITQFKGLQCGLLIINVLGKEPHKDAIQIPGEPFMNLRINSEWKSLEDYLSAMSSKYRVRNKKVLSVSESIEKRLLSDLPPSEWVASCARLLGKTLKKKTLAISPNLSEMLFNYSRSLKDDYKVWGYYHQNELIGFISAITADDSVFAMQLGINEEFAEEFSLYQRMMIDTIEWCILNNKKSLCMGRTSTEIKSTLGAEPVENSFLFYSQSSIIRGLLKLYTQYLHKPKSYVVRRPFKEQKNQPVLENA